MGFVKRKRIVIYYRVTTRDAKSTKADTKMPKAFLYTDMPVCVYMYVKSNAAKWICIKQIDLCFRP